MVVESLTYRFVLPAAAAAKSLQSCPTLHLNSLEFTLPHCIVLPSGTQAACLQADSTNTSAAQPLCWSHSPASENSSLITQHYSSTLTYVAPRLHSGSTALLFQPYVPGFTMCKKSHFLTPAAAFCLEPLMLLQMTEPKN